MNKNKIFLWLLLVFMGCQDVVEVGVPTDQQRLVLDAVIRIDDVTKSTFDFTVKASLSNSFFKEIQPTALDQISITNSDSGTTEILQEKGSGTGTYHKEVPMGLLTQGELTLSVNHKGNSYIAKTGYVPGVPIDTLLQGDGTLFSGDETEIVISYTDAPERTDFYLFDFDFNQYLVSEDIFYPGQSFQFSYFYDNGLEPGREVDISILGVDKQFFNYMNQVILQSGGDQGPFQTPAATVRGNIINSTEPDNFALGYFAVCQTFTKSIVIKEK